MKPSELRHGDVLLFSHRDHAPLASRAIRLITGSQFTHCAIVLELWTHAGLGSTDNYLIVLEQLAERQHSVLDFYRPNVGEMVTVVRPKFYVPKHDDLEAAINRMGYNYWSLVDSLINHALHRLTLGRWQFRAMLSKLKPYNTDCAQLVALLLYLQSYLNWEPDDFYNDTARFAKLGTLDFG